MKLKSLLDWSAKEFSHLPWRQNRSLYRTLVSEIMLQQTTVGTVKNHFERFVTRFPDLHCLASATEEELLVAWKGLGYYRRARNLKKIAQALVDEHQGEFPHSEEVLMKIPGIGPYTANAIIGIGMDKRALAIDANLERVIARLFGISSAKGPKLQKDIKDLFLSKKIFSEKVSARGLNEALMDLGRTFCQARKASCELCPLRGDCITFKSGHPLSYPKSEAGKKSVSVEHELELLRIIVLKKKKLLVYQKSKDEWLSGQFEVPTFILSTTDPKLKQYPKLEVSLPIEFSFQTGITKYKIKNKVVCLSEDEFYQFPFPVSLQWKPIDSPSSNFSTATLKALEKLSKS
jgi:A/G-specific adenine glycosylase